MFSGVLLRLLCAVVPKQGYSAQYQAIETTVSERKLVDVREQVLKVEHWVSKNPRNWVLHRYEKGKQLQKRGSMIESDLNPC